VANARADFQHKLSCTIVDEHQAAINIERKGILELQAAGLVVSAHGGQRKSVTKMVAAQEVGSLARQGGEQSLELILIICEKYEFSV
jgi:putative transposase